MFTTCEDHGRWARSGDITRSFLDPIIRKLPQCHAGEGKDKCAYCAYEAGLTAGYEKAIKEFKGLLDLMKAP